jgi:hypothetical protein
MFVPAKKHVQGKTFSICWAVKRPPGRTWHQSIKSNFFLLGIARSPCTWNNLPFVDKGPFFFVANKTAVLSNTFKHYNKATSSCGLSQK